MTPRRSVAACATGLLVGASFFAAGPALAAGSADCLSGNTVNAATQTGVDIQTLLTAGAPIICLSGTFVLSAPLTGAADVELFGLSDAVLDGNSAVRILEVTGAHVVKVQNVRFTRGSATDGGALKGATVQITDSTFDHNTAATGGAVRASTSLTVSGSTFEDNTATGGNGGGAVFFDTAATVTDSDFRRNSAPNGYGSGGAISSYNVLSLVSGSTFEDNTANEGGGAIRSAGITVVESTFARNIVASGTGGAIDTGNYTVTNSTFVGNSASSWAGAIYGGRATVAQSTFLNNTAPSGLSLWVRNLGNPGGSTFSGNIFASTASGQHIVDYDGSVSSDLGGNVFSSTSPETGFVANDPTTVYGITPAALFGANVLADNGGQVPTLALIPGAPAIDLVPAGSTVTTDARPWARVAANDAGAYEFDAVDPNAPVTPPVTPAATLPETGTESGWFGLVGAALLAAGALALAVARRQRRA